MFVSFCALRRTPYKSYLPYWSYKPYKTSPMLFFVVFVVVFPFPVATHLPPIRPIGPISPIGPIVSPLLYGHLTPVCITPVVGTRPRAAGRWYVRTRMAPSCKLIRDIRVNSWLKSSTPCCPLLFRLSSLTSVFVLIISPSLDEHFVVRVTLRLKSAPAWPC